MEKVRMSRPSGRRIYCKTGTRGLAVPMREIELSGENPPIRLYDTSGPYGDPATEPAPTHGLGPLRREWILERGDMLPHQPHKCDHRLPQAGVADHCVRQVTHHYQTDGFVMTPNRPHPIEAFLRRTVTSLISYDVTGSISHIFVAALHDAGQDSAQEPFLGS